MDEITERITVEEAQYFAFESVSMSLREMFVCCARDRDATSCCCVLHKIWRTKPTLETSSELALSRQEKALWFEIQRL